MCQSVLALCFAIIMMTVRVEWRIEMSSQIIKNHEMKKAPNLDMDHYHSDAESASYVLLNMNVISLGHDNMISLLSRCDVTTFIKLEAIIIKKTF